MPSPSRPVGVIADEILKIAGQVSAHNDAVKKLESDRRVLELELITAAEVVKLTEGGGANSKFRIEPTTVPQVEDWDDFYGYIHKNKYYHMLERRPTVLACREVWELGKEIPGVNRFTKLKVTVKGK